MRYSYNIEVLCAINEIIEGKRKTMDDIKPANNNCKGKILKAIGKLLLNEDDIDFDLLRTDTDTTRELKKLALLIREKRISINT